MKRYFDANHDSFFFTSTVVAWIDVFTRKQYRKILTDTFNWCVDNKGLKIHAYVIMPNHFHMVATSPDMKMSRVVASMKQFTSRQIYEAIKENPQESRKNWMSKIMEFSGERQGRPQIHQFWRHDNDPLPLWSPKVIGEKIHYIHQNPVRAGFVHLPQDWLPSSAGDYCGIEGPVKLDLVDGAWLKPSDH